MDQRGQELSFLSLSLSLCLCVCVCVCSGVLATSDDFESPGDVYEAVGVVLLEAVEGTSEAEVKELCRSLYAAMIGYIHTPVVSQATPFSLCKGSGLRDRVVRACA